MVSAVVCWLIAPSTLFSSYELNVDAGKCRCLGEKKKSPSHRWGEKHKITFLVCEVKGVYVYKHADTANTGASLYPHETQSFALLTVLDESVTMPHLAVGEIACQ